MAACNYDASELGLRQRKTVRKCDPGEKGGTANTASYSSASLNHRFFSCIATMNGSCPPKWTAVVLTVFCQFYLLHWYDRAEKELNFSESPREIDAPIPL